MPLAALLLLASVSSLRAAEPKFARYSDPTVAFDYPTGWTVSVRGFKAGRHCMIDVYRNDRWWDMHPAKTSGWNDFTVEFIDLEERTRLLQSEGETDDAVRSLSDYRRAIDCRPPAKTGTAYPPLFANLICEEPLGTMPLAGRAKGYLYRQLAENTYSRDPAFNSLFRQADVVFADPKDPKWLYRADAFGPIAEFNRYWPAFKHMVATMKLSPDAADLCGGAVPLLR
jgi:uncharacterized protein YbdZ (MbtH family)